ncbi:helix-turn-helix domain-containing protein [Halegenticoccus soli]|uniref:helix-turn-helix domain-containing protein n=1 Tax=Halegenticoccus soli TaxID=1985678 RepID=UPI000C6D971F|nr:helix-turn-helix domain-containing protein [Halegenticoccus soli]
MATIVRGTIPADEFALYNTLTADPELEFEVERIVKSGPDAIMPLVWIRGGESETVKERLDEDPSVENLSLLADFEAEQLYRMEWIDHVELVLHMITNSNATVMDAYGSDRSWSLRIMYPTRDSVSETHEFCRAKGLTFDVGVIRELNGEPAGRYGLSKEQYEALRTACERGYFDVPRESTLEDLADHLDVSHQALSERMRRGHRALVEDTLLVGPPNDE